jgi:glycosyltransferase involved in cell wall biosynthesis
MYLCIQATRQGQASYAHVHEIIKGLRKRGWEVQLFEPKYANNDNLPGPFGRLIAFITVQINLLLCMVHFKPDALYIRNHFATFPIALLAKIIHKPVVQEVNGPYEDLFIAWPGTRVAAPLFKWLIRMQLKWADTVVVVTPQLAKWVQNESGQRFIKTIPNGANIELFHPQAQLKFDLPKPYVVFFGALTKWQGIDTLIKAVNSSQWPKEVNLVIVGDGIESTVVQQATFTNSKIIYLGPVPYKEVAGIVANSLAGLSPQNNEGGRSTTGLLPLKLFETIACGVPVIVTDFPGQADLVKAYNCGVVVPPCNPDALARAVRLLHCNPSLRTDMGLRGRKAVEEKHSWDCRAADTDAVLNQLLTVIGEKKK